MKNFAKNPPIFEKTRGAIPGTPYSGAPDHRGVTEKSRFCDFKIQQAQVAELCKLPGSIVGNSGQE